MTSQNTPGTARHPIDPITEEARRVTDHTALSQASPTLADGANEYADWLCPECGNVPDLEVGDGVHDTRAGGCGSPVERTLADGGGE